MESKCIDRFCFACARSFHFFKNINLVYYCLVLWLSQWLKINCNFCAPQCIVSNVHMPVPSSFCRLSRTRQGRIFRTLAILFSLLEMIFSARELRCARASVCVFFSLGVAQKREKYAERES